MTPSLPIFCRSRVWIALGALALLAGCAVQPSGPTVMALPGSSKSFDQFRADDADCRRFALLQNGGLTSQEAATESGLRSAAVGTVIGAVAGAAMGGRDAAGTGAGAGLIVGSMAGADAARQGARITQRQYDQAYIQCMYAKGQRVPVPVSAAPPPRAVAPGEGSPPYLPPPPPPPR